MINAQTEIGYDGFYQQLASGLVRRVHKEHFFRELGNTLVATAEHAYVLREMDTLENVSKILENAPLPDGYVLMGRYYQALCIQRFGYGDVERAVSLFERVAEAAPPRFRVRAMISLAANSHYQYDNQSALSLYRDAAHFASCCRIHDAYATLGTQKMFAVINSEEGNHRDALTILEDLFPVAQAIRSAQPHVYYDYMNSLAVELCEAGRLEEARNVSQIVVASPFASAYPEWRETSDEIELKGLRASRSVVALASAIADPSLRHSIAGASVSPTSFEGGTLVRLPVVNRGETLATEESTTAEPARVLSMQVWKERMVKENDDPHKRRERPTTSAEKAVRLGEMENLGTRGMMLRAMEALADERVTDDQLRRALIILEGLESDENPGA